MDRLGKDIFTRICRKLAVRDQINLAEAYPRCQKLILKRCWLPRFRHVDTGAPVMMYFEHSPEIFKLLVPYIRKISIVEMTDLDFYFRYVYPRLKTFMQNDKVIRINVLCVLAAMCCPALECLCLKTRRQSGEGIKGMLNLQQIHSAFTPLKPLHLMQICDGRIHSLTYLDLCGYNDKCPLERIFSDVVKHSLTTLCVPYSVMSFGFVDCVCDMELVNMRWELGKTKMRQKRVTKQQLPPWAYFHKVHASRIDEMRVIKTHNWNIYQILRQAVPYLRCLTTFSLKYNRTEYSLQEFCHTIFYPTMMHISITDVFISDARRKRRKKKNDTPFTRSGFPRFPVPEFDFDGLYKLVDICDELELLNVRFLMRENIGPRILDWFTELVPLVEAQRKHKPLQIHFQCVKYVERTEDVIEFLLQSEVYKKQSCCNIGECTEEFDDINTDMIEYRFNTRRKWAAPASTITGEVDVEGLIPSDICTDYDDSDIELAQRSVQEVLAAEDDSVTESSSCSDSEPYQPIKKRSRY